MYKTLLVLASEDVFCLQSCNNSQDVEGAGNISWTHLLGDAEAGAIIIGAPYYILCMLT